MIRRMALSAVALAGLVLVSSALAIAPGDKAPDIQGLPGTDGKSHGLTNSKATVVCFTCNQCPVAVAYEDRFIEFTKKYKDKGVQFIAINCSTSEDLEKMKARAEEKGFNFPYVYDKTGAAPKSYGAKVTPHIYVLDGNRTVQYVGSFDDKQNGPSQNFVADAVNAILAGKTPSVKENKAFGCGIRLPK